MFDTAQEMYKDIKALHGKCHLMLIELEERAKQCADVNEHADLAYAMRECSKLLDDSRKSSDRLKELSERVGCVLWTRDQTGDAIKTPYCIANPDVTMVASLPKSGTPEYDTLMEHIGVPSDLWHGDNDAIRVHWPGFVAHLSQLSTAGKPLPPGIDMSKSHPRYAFKPLRKRKDVDAH